MTDTDGRTEADRLAECVLDSDEVALARLISLTENHEPGYRSAMKRLYRHTGSARTIGLTGPPGVGKSTLLDALVGRFREQGDSVGVVAVDPASPYTGGSILGDRIRQQELYDDTGVFFRSMSSRNQTGGIVAATFDAVHALDAFGKDVVLVETVGAGQGEVDVMKVTDTVCVVLIPGAGDDIQTNKAGMLETADVFVVNKSDLDGADETVKQLKRAIALSEADGAQPSVCKTVATNGEGIATLFATLTDQDEYLHVKNQRTLQETDVFWEEARIHARDKLDRKLSTLDRSEVNDVSDPYTAAEQILISLQKSL